MEREEILCRSRHDNKNGDEREIEQRSLASRNGYLVTTFLAGLFMILSYFDIVQGEFILFSYSMPVGSFLSLIFLIGSAVESIGKYLCFRKLSYLVWFVCISILCISVLIEFFLGAGFKA